MELKFCGHLHNILEKVCAKFQLNQTSFDLVLAFSSLVRAAKNSLRETSARAELLGSCAELPRSVGRNLTSKVSEALPCFALAFACLFELPSTFQVL